MSLAAGPDGKPGGSYQFSGSANSYIEFPNNGGLDVTHSITLLCWVYPQNTDGPIFNYLPTGRNWGVHMWMVWGKLFARYTHRNYIFTPHLLSAQAPTLNQWHYMGTTYDHTTGVARLWLDGQKAAELNIGANMMLATQDNVRMGVKSGDPRYFKGRISAMQVYNVALTPEQINEVKNAGRGRNRNSFIMHFLCICVYTLCADDPAFFPVPFQYRVEGPRTVVSAKVKHQFLLARNFISVGKYRVTLVRFYLQPNLRGIHGFHVITGQKL